jgi:diacylglycerol kinase family enzyme
VKALINGRPRRIDLGEVQVDGARRYFAVACGAGMDARVMTDTPPREKRRWRMGAYVATTIRMLPEVHSTPCAVTVDGVVWEVPAALVLILNCGEIIPPVVRVRSDVAFDDGLLDLLLVTADSAWEGMRAVWHVLRNATGSLRELPGLLYARGTTIAVAAAEPLPMQYDGEPWGTTPFTARVLPGALAVMAPVAP